MPPSVAFSFSACDSISVSYAKETIAAIATPPGRGGVGIVRVSGPQAPQIAQAVLGQCPPVRLASYLPFRSSDGSLIDEGIALYFKAPHSFTGEDVLELQGHGGPVVLDMVLRRVVALGARLAHPGEFSQQAFLNDKLDLAQAEAIADLIESASEEAARSALRSLQGEFSNQINQLVEKMTHLRMHVESAIDFPEEEIDFLSDGAITEQIHHLKTQLTRVLERARQGCLLREGLNIVIAGQPNAGKSSLLNYLAQRESAIVTDVAGTTRDVLREEINLDGLPLHIIDTAGLRDSADPVERIGIERAWQQIEQADAVLLVVDSRSGITQADRDIIARLPSPLPLTVVFNKIDLSARPPATAEGALGPEFHLSAKTGYGMDLLREHLKARAGYRSAGEGNFTARRRHIDALERAQALVLQGEAQLKASQAGELLAEDLRQAQRALGEITGEFSSDDLLGQIFSSFCIGK